MPASDVNPQPSDRQLPTPSDSSVYRLLFEGPYVERSENSRSSCERWLYRTLPVPGERSGLEERPRAVQLQIWEHYQSHWRRLFHFRRPHANQMDGISGGYLLPDPEGVLCVWREAVSGADG
jgi:hypothetical protein